MGRGTYVRLDLKAKDVAGAVDRVLGKHALDRLPPLISHLALGESRSELTDLVNGLAADDILVARAAEEISMPRGSFGSRPVLVPTVYEMAFLNYLVAQIPEISFEVRTAEQRGAFYSFACSESETHQVQFDISSYYEYVSHDLLLRELALYGTDAGLLGALRDTLETLYPLGLGLPQMQRASDALSEAYLAPVDRLLLRENLNFRRYADDFRINATSWESAVDILSRMGEATRGLGLSVAAAKSRILTSEEVVRRNGRLKAVLDEYESEAAELLTQYIWIEDYEDVDVEEIPPEDEEALEEALHKICKDWLEHHNRQRGREVHEMVGGGNPLSELLPSALQHLRESEVRISNDVLTEIPFAEPVRLQAVCEYVLERPPEEEETNWELITELSAQARQSPWARIWLAHTMATLPAPPDHLKDRIGAWIAAALRDKHELVRAEAAWAHARLKTGPLLDWSAIAGGATALTHSGLAAAAGAAGAPPSVGEAFTKAGPLVRSAFHWGESVADQ